jgi:hypothetical protein
MRLAGHETKGNETMTTTEKNAAITSLLIRKIREGMSPAEALRDLLGEDLYQAFVSDLYEELRKVQGMMA